MNAFEHMRRELYNMLDVYDRGFHGRSRVVPALNIWEDSESLYAEAELPGMTLDDLETYVEGDALVLKGGRKAAMCDDCTCHRQERPVGSFARTVRLPAQINADKVEATLKNGVLSITLPKAEVAKARRIQVTVN
ncbi:MAG: Hsp20/alpha crystallin family protein [Planctomycetota bacterium]